MIEIGWWILVISSTWGDQLQPKRQSNNSGRVMHHTSCLQTEICDNLGTHHIHSHHRSTDPAHTQLYESRPWPVGPGDELYYSTTSRHSKVNSRVAPGGIPHCGNPPAP